MKRLKLKPFVLPMVYVAVVVSIIITIMATANVYTPEAPEEPTYVTDGINDTTVPVVKETVKLTRPYLQEGVIANINYYDYQAESSAQEGSIIKHENTYMQNSGVDFVLEETFEVVAVLDGEVIEVKEDELLGTVVHIKHDNDFISVYQSLTDVVVKEGDKVTQNQKIGMAGTNKLDTSNKFHVHFELYDKGNIVNPNNYFDKEITLSE